MAEPEQEAAGGDYLPALLYVQLDGDWYGTEGEAFADASRRAAGLRPPAELARKAKG